MNAVAEELFEAVDDWSQQVVEQVGEDVITCKRCLAPGCCRQLVLATDAEAEAIAEFLTAEPGAIEETVPRMHLNLPKQETVMRGATRLDLDDRLRRWLDRDIHCAFLDEDSRCMIYPVRPVACRAMWIVSSEVRCQPKWKGVLPRGIDSADAFRLRTEIAGQALPLYFVVLNALNKLA